MTDTDPYKTLGVDKAASADEVKRAYRRLARRYHPDKNKGDQKAEERFKQINEAYDILGDERKRREYDAMRRSPFGAGQFGKGAGGPGGPFRDFADAAGSGFGGIFEGLFGSGGPGGPFSRPRQGQDVRTDLSIPFELAVRGGKQKITVRLTEPGPDGKPRSTTKEVSVKIPAGIEDGQKIRLAGAGQPGPNNGPPGSLMITVRVQPHAVFTREGRDIHSTVEVDLPTAILGGSVKVRTIEQAVTLKIPPGTQPGQRFKIRGQGGPRGDGSRGDHYVTIEARLPKELTARQRKLLEEFAESLR